MPPVVLAAFRPPSAAGLADRLHARGDRLHNRRTGVQSVRSADIVIIAHKAVCIRIAGAVCHLVRSGKCVVVIAVLPVFNRRVRGRRSQWQRIDLKRWRAVTAARILFRNRRRGDGWNENSAT